MTDTTTKKKPVGVPRKELRAALVSIMHLPKIDKAIMISVKNRFVYAPIPKVANSSIKHLIYRMENFHSNEKIRENIVHDINYGPVIRPSMLGFNSPILHKALFSNTYFRFTFVRNPYAKALSNYLDRYMAVHSTVRRHVNAVALEKGYIADVEDIVTFSQYLQCVSFMEVRKMDIHIAPQYVQSMSALVTYDFIGTLETLAEDLKIVADRVWDKPEIDLGFQSPSRTNATDKLREKFTDADIALINDIYAKDFEVFGYPMVQTVSDFDDPEIVMRRV